MEFFFLIILSLLNGRSGVTVNLIFDDCVSPYKTVVVDKEKLLRNYTYIMYIYSVRIETVVF